LTIYHLSHYAYPPIAPFSLTVSPAFWHKLTDLKIDVLKLSDESLPITVTYTVGKSITDRETGKEVVPPTNFSAGGESFDVALASRSGESVQLDSFNFAYSHRDRIIQEFQHHRGIQVA
jgi:hypothetical protein